MWDFETRPRYPLPDVTRFVERINAWPEFWLPDRPITVARAPGRLDVIGGIADYSGALVLELPLHVATLAAAQPDPSPAITIYSTNAAGFDAEPLVQLPLNELVPQEQPLHYAAARRLLAADPRRSWAAYVAGVLVVLQRERGERSGGIRLFIHSDVPAGKGVSSSASLEVATMQAITGAYNSSLDGREMALLCQKVENLVVGAPCGVMDQITSACGEQDRLTALLCQPAELQAPVTLPPDVAVWGIDSGIRHAVSGEDYGSVRTGAFMGYRIIADLAGLPVTPLGEGRVMITDPHWHGYLANIAPSLWETAFAGNIPLMLDGATFLERYGGITDTVTTVDPARSYAIRQPAAHPIYEHQRVRLFRVLLQNRSLDDEQLALLGELMYQSHASYSACGLGSAGTDRLVNLARQAGPEAGVYGAKITGGGSGGTVAVLARSGAGAAVQRIAAHYTQETGRATVIFAGSSPGAQQFGVVRLIPAP